MRDPVADSYSNRDSDAYTHTNTNTNTDGDSDGYSNSNGYVYSDAETYAYAYTYTHTNTDGHSNSNSSVYSDAETYTESTASSYSGTAPITCGDEKQTHFSIRACHAVARSRRRRVKTRITRILANLLKGERDFPLPTKHTNRRESRKVIRAKSPATSSIRFFDFPLAVIRVIRGPLHWFQKSRSLSALSV